MDTTVLKALMLIEALAHSEESRGISDLARELELSKSNVHRLLKTLQSRDYVRRVDANSTYQLTTKLWELGSLVRGRLRLTAVSAQYMEQLRTSTSESVNLAVLDGNEVVYIDQRESPLPLAAYQRIGGRAPAFCVATGKAMLAYLPDETVQALVPKFARYTEHTVSSFAELRAELAKVRELGYASSYGEFRKDLFGIAAPVWDAGGNVAGAIGVLGPSTRYEPKRVKSLTAHVVKAARNLSGAMGYRPR